MRVTLIANPTAGRSRSLRAATTARQALLAGGWETQIALTAAPGDAVRLARDAARGGCDAVFACGGDGTLSEVMTGLLDTGVPAGLIPAGTGNDFARTARVSLDPAGAARQALRGRPGPVDMLEINGGALWAINVLGVGFDVRVCQRINRRSRWLGGAPAYLIAVAQELWDLRPTALKLRVDGQEWQGEALLAALCNAQSYGAGMRIAPQADLHDGLMDVVAVTAVGRLQFLQAFPRVFRGTHLTHPAVRLWRGRQVELETAEPVAVNVDGDLRAQTPLQVSVSPGRGRLWLPG